MSAKVVLEVHGWHSQCGFCGYGGGGWQYSPALDGKPILDPESTVCHGCGQQFTHVLDACVTGTTRPINREPEAA